MPTALGRADDERHARGSRHIVWEVVGAGLTAPILLLLQQTSLIRRGRHRGGSNRQEEQKGSPKDHLRRIVFDQCPLCLLRCGIAITKITNAIHRRDIRAYSARYLARCTLLPGWGGRGRCGNRRVRGRFGRQERLRLRRVAFVRGLPDGQHGRRCLTGRCGRGCAVDLECKERLRQPIDRGDPAF